MYARMCARGRVLNIYASVVACACLYPRVPLRGTNLVGGHHVSPACRVVSDASDTLSSKRLCGGPRPSIRHVAMATPGVQLSRLAASLSRLIRKMWGGGGGAAGATLAHQTGTAWLEHYKQASRPTGGPRPFKDIGRRRREEFWDESMTSGRRMRCRLGLRVSLCSRCGSQCVYNTPHSN